MSDVGDGRGDGGERDRPGRDADDGAAREAGRSGAEQPHRPSAWHWGAAALGLLIVVGAFAFLVRDGLTRRDDPFPVLHVAADTVVRTPAGWIVRVRVRNDGGIAAASVRVRGDLRDAAGATETREVLVDHVPPSSTREAGLVFSRDPRAGRLELRALSFDVP